MLKSVRFHWILRFGVQRFEEFFIGVIQTHSFRCIKIVNRILEAYWH